MASPDVTFYRYTQEHALSLFPSLLKPHFPCTNAIYTRLISPLNTPEKHILYAATFPHSSAPTQNYTLIFSDRTRPLESQVWLFNPLFTSSTPLSSSDKQLLAQHAEAALLFIKNTAIPESSGWPFKSIIKFASIHESMSVPLVAAAKRRGARIEYDTIWNLWSINLKVLTAKPLPELPSGWSTCRVPEEKLETVISFSSIKRHKETLRNLPSACLIDESGEMVAWAFVGTDGSLCTMHVLEECRGRGLAKLVARWLLDRYVKGHFGSVDKQSGWCHAEVGEGNRASESVMRSLGATTSWRTGYAGVDVEELQ